ncbi:Cj0069 family protein, partial [Campylobacter coli]|nr:Cj0069 family protein [Campylobacter coli]
RVLKQNRGSTGEGIWRVSVEGEVKGDILPLDTKIKCTEAKDNHVEHRELGEFMDFCEQYIIGDNGMLVDMTFLPRIKEGEIRLLMLYNTPVNVVHKKPAEDADAFSATLFSGAQYRYDKPEDWQNLVDMFLGELPKVRAKLGNYDLPLIWT